MSPHSEDPTPAEAAFVRRVSEVYALPPRTAAQRVAFQAALDERLRRGGRRVWLRLAAASVAVAGAAVLVVNVLPERPADEALPGDGTVMVDPASSRAEARPQEDAIFALAMGSETKSDEALPADYEAIAGVFLGR